MAEEVKARQFSFRRTIVNVASQWGRMAVLIAVNLLLTAYVLSRVGKVSYGAWSGALTIAGFLMLLDSGLGMAVQQRIAHYSRSNDTEGFRRVFSVSLPLFFCMGCIAAGLGLLIAANYGSIFPKVPQDTVIELAPAIRWAGCAVAASLLSIPASGALLGMQRFEITNLNMVASHLMRAAVVVLCFTKYGPRLEFLGLAMFASGLVQLVGNHICLQVFYRNFRPIFKGLGQEFRQLFSFSYHAVFWSLCNMMIYRSGPVLSLWFLGPTSATYVYICGLLLHSLRDMVITGATVAIPVAASIHEEKLSPLILRGTRISGYLAMVGAGGLMGFAGSLFQVWQGPGFEECVWILAVGLAGSVLVWTVSLLSATMIGRKILGYSTLLAGLRAVATIIGGIVGGYLYDAIGLVGGMAFGNGIISVLLYPAVAAKYFGVSRFRLFRSVFPTQFLLGLLAMACGLIITRIYPPESWPTMIIEVSIVGLILLPTLWFWGLDEGVRSVVNNKVFARVFTRS